MIDLPEVLTLKVQSTPSAAAFLDVEEGSHLPRTLGMATSPGGPIDQVAVKGTFGSLDFHEAPDLGGRVGQEAGAVGGFKHPMPLALGFPVFAGNPFGLVMVIGAFSPGPQLVEENVVQFAEGLGRDHGGVESTPAADHRVEVIDQSHLGLALMPPDDGPEVDHVAVDCLLAWFDEGLVPLRAFPFTHRVLPDVEAEKIEANGSVIRV